MACREQSDSRAMILCWCSSSNRKQHSLVEYEREEEGREVKGREREGRERKDGILHALCDHQF